MSTTGAQVIASVRLVLLDPSPGDWFTDPDLLDFINTAQVKAVLARPDLNPSVVNLSLVQGIVQQLSTSGVPDGVAVLDIYHNTATGTVVRQAPRSMLDNGLPNWPAANPQEDVIHWLSDPRVKTMFRVYPPNNQDGEVSALISTVPARLTATSDLLEVSDLYKPVIDALVLAECFAANSVKRDVEKSSFYESKAMSMLGLNAQAGAALAPKLGAPGGA